MGEGREMAELPEYGKITKGFFDKVIYPNLGAKRNEVIVGPSSGVDNCVVKIGSGEVLVATTDPLSYIPELGPEDSAWLSVNLIASDLSTSGFKPQYLILDLNLPPSMPGSLFEEYWSALSNECEKQGIAIIGGHTGKFKGLESTVIGGGVMFSIGSSRTYLTSSGGKVGDKIIVTKGAAIATTGILSRVFPRSVQRRIGEDGLRRSSSYFRKISVVKDALAAVTVGVRSSGVTAMHDCTEGGVLSAIHELASASSLGALVNKEQILISSETMGICDLFEVDPFVSLGEGALVLSCVPQKVSDVMSALSTSGIESSVVGSLREKSQQIMILENGKKSPIDYPVVDPYWAAFYSAKDKGWN